MRMITLDKIKIFTLILMGLGFVFFCFLFVSNEAYKEEMAKINQENHSNGPCWYCYVEPLKENTAE